MGGPTTSPPKNKKENQERNREIKRKIEPFFIVTVYDVSVIPSLPDFLKVTSSDDESHLKRFSLSLNRSSPLFIFSLVPVFYRKKFPRFI